MWRGRGDPLHLLLRAGLAAAMAAAVIALAVPSAGAGLPGVYAPKTTRLGAGLAHLTLSRKGPAEVVHVAKIAKDAPYDLRAVPAKGGIGKGLERTSSICRRVGCAVAVNGDFWKPGTDVPIGGVVSLGRLLRTPAGDHNQVSLSADGGLRTGPLRFRAKLVPDDLKPLTIHGINRKPGSNELILFTPAFGGRTATKKNTVELTLRARRPAGRVALSKTTIVHVAENGSAAGNAPIPIDGAVLSGRGSGATYVRDLLRRIRAGRTAAEALLRVDSNVNAIESIGGTPVLVRGGRAVPPADKTNFVAGRHPRTMIGWTPKGEVLLVTVDGRQPGYSAGMTLAEAARLMVNLGATDALNLDGGGSTSFVSKGLVANRPSDRAVRTSRGTTVVHRVVPGQGSLGNVERPVAIALAVVPKDKKVAVAASDAMAKLPIPQTLDVAAPQPSDVASDPTGALPALVPMTSTDNSPLRAFAVAFVALGIALAAGTTGYRRGLRRVTGQR